MRRLCRRRVAVSVLVLVAALLVPAAVASAQGPGQAVPRGAWQPSVVIRWNAALVEAVRRTQFRPMWTARALAIVHTAIYDAWAAYDPVATGVHWDRDLRRPLAERDQAHAEAAVSLAAYQTLVDSFPTEKVALFDPLLRDLGLAATPTTDAATSAGLGSRCAALVLAVRHVDGANQLGSAGAGPYSDYTDYLPVNTPDLLTDPNRWQPQRAADGTVQTFLTPQWGLVRPFALTSAAQFRPGRAAAVSGPSLRVRGRGGTAAECGPDRSRQGNRRVPGRMGPTRKRRPATGACSRSGCRPAITTRSVRTS